MNPLTAIYGAGTAMRNSLFDRHVLRARRLAKPVVSVGNLSTGGSGKTPFVIALGELLQERRIPFDVLSRGYRRKTKGVFVVDPSGGAADFGDEPLLIARRLGVPVVVGESRYEAGRVAEQKFATELHLLDDGYQHRSLARDFDIVLLSAEDLDDRLLPLGRLREPVSALARADAVLIPDDLDMAPLAVRNKLIWRMSRALELSDPPVKPVVFCGIAKPQRFFAQVRAAGITPAAEIVFGDHHAYDMDEVQAIRRAALDHDAGGFVTTEKDLVNLGEQRSALHPLSLAVLRLTLERPTDVLDTILARITERKPCS